MEKVNKKKAYVVQKETKYDVGKLNIVKDHLDWIKRQLEYATFSNEFKLRMDLKKGEIYEIDWGVNVNAEFSNRHFGVVLRDSNEYDPLVLVCPLKTNKKGAHPASDIDLGFVYALQSTHRTLAVINQTRTIDKMRIFSKNAISDNSIEDREIPILEDKKVNLILTAYFNFIYGANIN
jgi:mRNA-degrading endonuclease toxin of MazEF toxin-antitoxin module